MLEIIKHNIRTDENIFYHTMSNNWGLVLSNQKVLETMYFKPLTTRCRDLKLLLLLFIKNHVSYVFLSIGF